MTTSIYSLSISARLTLDMHSLNNEGGEGNQIQTRMVDIVAADGRMYNVNAISGDMLKHIQAEHLYRISQGAADLPLCSACQVFDANRISADGDYIVAIQGKSDGEAIDLMLERCTLDDIEGNLITADRSTPRKSVAEFGWMVGVPVDEQGNEQTSTGSYFHVKYATERGRALAPLLHPKNPGVLISVKRPFTDPLRLASTLWLLITKSTALATTTSLGPTLWMSANALPGIRH